MGDMTRAELMSQGGLSANNDDVNSAFVIQWLNNWLKRTAKSWSWPQLKVRIEDLPIAAATKMVTVGKGTFTPLHLHRLLGNYVMWRNSDYTSRGMMLSRQLLDADPDTDESVTLVTQRRGNPNTCKVRVGDGTIYDGAFRIYPDPVQEVQLFLSFDAHIVPGNLSGNQAVPWYPNDRTLEQAVKCAFMELDEGGNGDDATRLEMDKLGRMVVDDRDFDGEAPGDNQAMMLDPSVFR